MTCGIGPLRLENGGNITKDIDVAEVLSDSFSSAFTVEDTNGIGETSSSQRNIIPLITCDFVEDTIIKLLANVKLNKTPHGQTALHPGF